MLTEQETSKVCPVCGMPHRTYGAMSCITALKTQINELQTQLEESWKALQKKWGVEAEEKKRKRALEAPTMTPVVNKPYRRETPEIKSLPFTAGPCVKAPDKVYTGTAIKGIGTMHKSNAVPIFSNEDAVDIAKMRR